MKRRPPRPPCLRQRGFSFVEVLIGVAILAMCAVPLGDAIRNGIAASQIGAAKARELRCMKSMMETVLAEPYQKLAAAARGKDTASSYSRAADTACAARNVYIAPYEQEYGKLPVFLDASAGAARLESAMLYVSVAPAAGGYTFTMLVAQ